MADEPVAVVVKDLPARLLLKELGSLLDYRWRRLGKEGAWRYEIWQDRAGKKREEAERQASLTAVEKRFRDELARHVQMAALPTEELQRLKEVGEWRHEGLMKLPRERRWAFLSRPEEWGRGWRSGIASKLSSPVTRAMVTFIGRFSAPQWALLRRGASLSFSANPQRGELLLPAEMARIFRAARPSMDAGVGLGNPEAAEDERQRQRGDAEEWAAATDYRVTVRMDVREFPTQGSLTLQARVVPIRPGAPRQFSSFQGGEGTQIQIDASAVDLQPRGAEVTSVSDSQLAKDPVFGIKRRFKPAARAPVNHLGVKRTWVGRTLADLLPDIAQIYSVQVIADAYRTVTPTVVPLPTEPTTLAALLDRIAPYTHTWSRRGNILLLRSKTWFFDRPREIPLRFVRRWKESCARYGLLSLEEWLEIVTTLTELQLSTLSRVTQEADLPVDFYPAANPGVVPMLRLYASLTPAQRQALWQGASLLVAQMTVRERTLLEAALQASSHDRPEPPALKEVGSGSLLITRESLTRTITRGGAGVDSRQEALTKPDGTVDGGHPATSPQTPVIAQSGGNHYRVTTLGFMVQYGSDMQVLAELKVATR